jgi:hypothetical protein
MSKNILTPRTAHWLWGNESQEVLGSGTGARHRTLLVSSRRPVNDPLPEQAAEGERWSGGPRAPVSHSPRNLRNRMCRNRILYCSRVGIPPLHATLGYTANTFYSEGRRC